MIERIVQDPLLSLLVCDECAENEVSVTFDGAIDRSDYVILKVDDFYNSLNIEKRPPAPDCLIVLKCKEKGHALAVVELKNIHTGSSLPLDNLIRGVYFQSIQSHPRSGLQAHSIDLCL
jgi:hypothetical protein